MENKDLSWRDITINWPKGTYCYYDNKKEINKLSELSAILEAQKVEVIPEEEDYNVMYYTNKGLICTGCRIKIIYPDCYEKIKFGGEIVWQK